MPVVLVHLNKPANPKWVRNFLGPAWYQFGFFLLCVLSRLATTIHYIEDVDSLRFASSILEYDVARLQPHFPAYPVFCFAVKIFYMLTGSFALAFSLIGAIATWAVINVMLWLSGASLPSRMGLLIATLGFFNPLIWFIWLGGIVLVGGSVYSLWPRARAAARAGPPERGAIASCSATPSNRSMAFVDHRHFWVNSSTIAAWHSSHRSMAFVSAVFVPCCGLRAVRHFV
mgnify:CR=1 FL=1